MVEDDKQTHDFLINLTYIFYSTGAVIVGGNATVTHADATASNGVIHAIDSVLLPPSLEKKLTKMIYKTGKRKLIGINGD